MRLEREAHESLEWTDTLVQVRELGGRLEHVTAQYDRLVRDLFGEAASSSEFDSRLYLVNREFGNVARRLQELFVLDYEARHHKKSRPIQQTERRRRAPRQVAALRDVGRSSVVTPFVPAAHRQRVPMMPDTARIAAVR
jgi:hypothetical protein